MEGWGTRATCLGLSLYFSKAAQFVGHRHGQVFLNLMILRQRPETKGLICDEFEI